jgi:hypothetical protein
MFCRSDRSDTKRLFGFFEEKGRAATPASFSHVFFFMFHVEHGAGNYEEDGEY